MAASQVIEAGQDYQIYGPIDVAAGEAVTVALFADHGPVTRGARIRILLDVGGDSAGEHSLVDQLLGSSAADRARRLLGPASYYLERKDGDYGGDFGAALDTGA